MHKQQYLYHLLLALMLVFSQCTKPDEMGEHAEHGHATAEEYYTCPMHPSVRSDRPGACPVCNMALVKVSGNQPGEGEGFRLTPWQRQLANIEVIPVGITSTNRSALGLSGTAAILTGEVVQNENAVENITARVPGRIDRLMVRSTGVQVQKGQPLYEIYSEQLIAAQQEYLLALQQEGIALDEIRDELASAARQKLLLWGMTETQIRQLVRRGKPNPSLIFYSPVTGTVMDLFLREGSYVQEGTPVLKVANLDEVWVQAQLYPQELGLLNGNPEVKIVSEATPQDTLKAKLVVNNPALEQNRQLNLATFQVENSNGNLKPGMLAYVLVGNDGSPTTETKKSIVVPKSAVLPGEMPMVWVEMPDSTFQNRMVKLGAETRERVEVLEGLHAGERLVVRGVYLLNSEYILRKGPAAVHQH